MEAEPRDPLLDGTRTLDMRLDEIQRLASDGGAVADAPLRLRALELLEMLEQRFACDERELVPAIRASRPWGRERAERLALERREQRLLLRFLFDALRDRRRPPALVANALRDFARAVREDLEAEEWLTADPTPLRSHVFLDVETQ